MEYRLLQGDCLELMKDIPDESIDMILCDPPYGTTFCYWDEVIPFEDMWKQYNRIIKPNGAIVLFGTEPFSSKLRMSNLKGFKYDLIWQKAHAGNFFNAKYRPLSKHEVISIFSKNGKKTKYNPQMVEGEPYKKYQKAVINGVNNHKIGVGKKDYSWENKGTRHPGSILNFRRDWKSQNQLHPTQKPVKLLEWLIKSYSDEGDVILDNCMGSGSTGIACLNTGRNFIGMELDENYFNIAKKRIEESGNITKKIIEESGGYNGIQ